jgi:hypothetical protein
MGTLAELLARGMLTGTAQTDAQAARSSVGRGRNGKEA